MEGDTEREREQVKKQRKKKHVFVPPLLFSTYFYLPFSFLSSLFTASSILNCIIISSLSFSFIFLLPPSFPHPLTSNFYFFFFYLSLSVERQPAVIRGIVNCHCAAWKTHTHTQTEEMERHAER